MPPVVTLSTGLEVSADSLFGADRGKLRKGSRPGMWPRVRGKSPSPSSVSARPQQEHHVVYESEAELIESARQRRARSSTPARKACVPTLTSVATQPPASAASKDASRSPSPIKRGVASARHCQMGIRTADVVGYKIVTDDADDMHAEFRIVCSPLPFSLLSVRVHCRVIAAHGVANLCAHGGVHVHAQASCDLSSNAALRGRAMLGELTRVGAPNKPNAAVAQQPESLD